MDSKCVRSKHENINERTTGIDLSKKKKMGRVMIIPIFKNH